ncbi:hypothetical protein Golomagni_04463, partial [Golovinomyces magnicellulatus]
AIINHRSPQSGLKNFNKRPREKKRDPAFIPFARLNIYIIWNMSHPPESATTTSKPSSFEFLRAEILDEISQACYTSFFCYFL